MWAFIPIGILAWFIYARFQYKHEKPIQRAKNRAEVEADAQTQPYYDFYGNLRYPTEYVDPVVAYWDWAKKNPCGEAFYLDEDYQIPSGVVSHGGRYTGRTK